MKTIALELSGVRTLWALHERLKETFDLPDYYGRNMDALWDCLHCAFEEDTTIELRNLSALPGELREAAETLLALFRELERTDPEVRVRVEGGAADNADFMV